MAVEDFKHFLDDVFGIRDREVSDRELLIHLAKEIRTMALDLTKLTAALAKVSTDVDALLAAQGTAAAQSAADQAAVDAVVPSVEAISAKVEAALAPPAPPAQ